METYKNISQLAGRIVVGMVFLFFGANHFMNFAAMTGYTASKGVPMAELAVIGSGVLLLAAGLSILLGYKIWIGVAALALFFLPVTFMMHNFWAVQGEAQMMEMVNFLKNMGLMGSAFIYAAVPSPLPYSLESFFGSRAKRIPVTRPVEQH